MRDEVIRIILEAKDKLSNVVRSAERNVNNSLGNMRNDLRVYDRDSERYSKNFRRRLADEEGSIRIWSKTLEDRLRRVQNSFNKFRNDASKPIDFGKVERGAGGRFTSIRQQQIDEREARRQARRDAIAQSPVGRAFTAFQKGRGEAAELEAELRKRFAANKEELAQRKRELEEEIHLKRESIIKDGNIQREQLRRDIVERNKNLDSEILKRTQSEANRQAKRDEILNKEIRTVNADFEARRKKAEDALREEIYQRKQIFYDEQFARKQQLRDDIASIRSSSQYSKAQKDREIDALRKAEADINRKEQRRRDEDIRVLELADDKIKRSDATARDIDIAERRSAAAEIRRKDSQETDETIKKLRAASSERNKEDEVALASELRQRRQQAETEFRTARNALRTGANEAEDVKAFIEARKQAQALNQDNNRLTRSFNAAGNAFGDLTRGFRRGRSDLREIDNIARRADTSFARFGQTIGKFSRDFGRIINLRWFLIISALRIVGQLVVVLAANLISLASSAAIAAAALGAGLVAAIAQALPVVGLLAASFSRVGAAFTAAQQATKAGATSSQDARAQADAQTAAQQRLTDALYSQKQAVQQLADARRQAKRDIVDSINAEIDANFALKDAEFAVLDAKQRLRELELQNKQDNQAVKDAQAQVKEAKERLAAAKKEGDQAEISNAQQQLAIAQQNLSDAQGQAVTQKDRKRQVDEQKLAVKEAQQQLKEARIAQKRQEQDTARTLKLGVKGNQAVVDALHGVAQANREVANAERGVTEAHKKQASAGNVLQQQLSQLDPAERGLYKAFRRIRDTFKKEFRPITDIIVNAVKGAVDRFNIILQDPKILKAFRGLATAIGQGIGDLSKHFSSKGFINSFIGFIHEATRNLPTLIKIIENLADAFLGVAKAGAPVVRDILGRFANFTGRFAKAVNAPVGGSASPTARGAVGITGVRPGETRGERFISGAQKYLDSWIKLASAIGRVFKYLFIDAAPAGTGLVNALTRFFNNLANWLRDNPAKVDKFFKTMANDLKTLAKVLFPVVSLLFSVLSGDQAITFTKAFTQIVIPGLKLVITILDNLAQAALFLINLPIFGPFAKTVLEATFAVIALDKFFPAATKRAIALGKAIIKWIFLKDAATETSGISKIRGVFGRLVLYIRTTVIPAAGRMAKAFIEASVRITKALVTMALNGIKALASLIAQGFKAVVTFITETLIPALIAMGEAMYASLGPWGLVALAVAAVVAAIVILLRHFHLLKPVLHFVEGLFKSFWNVLKDIFNWVRSNWGKMLQWLIYPFKQAYLGIKSAFNTIKGLISDVVGWVKDHWKTLAAILVAVFIPGGILLVAIYKFKDKIINAFKDIKDFIIKIFKDVVGWLKDHFQVHVKVKHFFGIPYPSITFGKQDSSTQQDAPSINPKTGPVAPIAPVPGFNQPPKRRRQQFADGGLVRGADGQAVHIVAHAGEWVLNKVQQAKIAHRLNETTQQVSAYLFGTNKGKGKPSQGHPHVAKRGGRTTKSLPYKSYNLVSQTDDNGNVVWFIEMSDGSYAGVTTKDAMKIQKSHGNFIPGYIRRDTHGFSQHAIKAKKKIQHFMQGGIVGGNYMPSYQMGGVVTSPQSYAPTNISTDTSRTHHKKIEQNFNVKTQGETDWNYVMRLAAQHAQESF